MIFSADWSTIESGHVLLTNINDIPEQLEYGVDKDLVYYKIN